ncbi:MAG: hypothetical protein ACOX6G_09040 [Christensenellales bacterium]|nr:hypothetical protein [Clostridiales bacterium]
MVDNNYVAAEETEEMQTDALNWQNRSKKGLPIVDFVALREYRKKYGDDVPAEKFIIGYEE